MNSVQLLGRLTRDPEMRATSNTTVTRFTVATDRKEGADFIACTAFGKTAENISKYFKKGNRIAVFGSIRTSSYEKDGQKRYTTEVWVSGFDFCESKGSGGSPSGYYEDASDEPLPWGD